MRKTNCGGSNGGLLLIAAIALARAPTVSAAVRLPRIFSNQLENPLVIFVWVDAKGVVSVTLASDPREAKANGRGEWNVNLPARKAGGPFTLEVLRSSSVLAEDVLGAVGGADG